MKKYTDMLINGQLIKRLYEKQFEQTREQYHISQFELDILAFLANNPGFDTASDIVEIRMIAKSYVSTSVESLIKKGLIIRVPDKNDRRIIHLYLTENTAPILAYIRIGQDQFLNMLTAEMTSDEIKIFKELLAKIFNNVNRALEK